MLQNIMTVEIQKYVLKGWTKPAKKGKKHFIEKIISISVRDGEHQPILERHAAEFMAAWPTVIESVTWEEL